MVNNNSVENDYMDALKFLEEFIKKHGLEEQMPTAREWVKKEFYSVEDDGVRPPLIYRSEEGQHCW